MKEGFMVGFCADLIPKKYINKQQLSSMDISSELSEEE